MKTPSATARIAAMGIMLGLIIVLAITEQAIPPLPFMIPGIKLGLSNVVIMYCVFFFGKREALFLGILKSAFTALLRGLFAGLLSLCGGVLSITVTVLMIMIFKNRISYIAVSICGAVTHNLGQLTAASLLMRTDLVFFYFPVLIGSGVLFGTVTGLTLSVLLPAFGRTFKGAPAPSNEVYHDD